MKEKIQKSEHRQFTHSCINCKFIWMAHNETKCPQCGSYDTIRYETMSEQELRKAENRYENFIRSNHLSLGCMQLNHWGGWHGFKCGSLWVGKHRILMW